jgi:hypothetical protein
MTEFRSTSGPKCFGTAPRSTLLLTKKAFSMEETKAFQAQGAIHPNDGIKLIILSGQSASLKIETPSLNLSEHSIPLLKTTNLIFLRSKYLFPD